MSIEEAMADDERLGREIVAAMRNLADRPALALMNALYAAAYEVARRTGQTPRTVFEACFSDAPSDDEWRDDWLPLLDEAA